MDDWRKYLDPDDMAPKERLDRIVDLLAMVALRLVKPKENEKGVTG